MKNLITRLFPVFLIAQLFFIACKKEPDDKGNVSGDFIGVWEGSATVIKIDESKNGTYNLDASSGGVTVSENASGPATLSDDVLTIGTKKLHVNTYPSQKSLSQGGSNTYIVLDNNTLYKKPFVKDACTNGVRDNNETGIDCGGTCGACPTCFDGLLNQDEEAIDCGGSCINCPTCLDGKKNQNETGIDCGGTCDPCETNLCSIPFGFGKNDYDGSSLVSCTGSDFTSTNPGRSAAVTTLFFTTANKCVAISVYFFRKTFLQMPENTTQLFTTFNSDNNEANGCTVDFITLNGTLNALSHSYVYLKRVDANTYNIKFCDLKANKTDIYDKDGNFSVNMNFTIN